MEQSCRSLRKQCKRARKQEDPDKSHRELPSISPPWLYGGAVFPDGCVFATIIYIYICKRNILYTKRHSRPRSHAHRRRTTEVIFVFVNKLHAFPSTYLIAFRRSHLNNLTHSLESSNISPISLNKRYQRYSSWTAAFLTFLTIPFREKNVHLYTEKTVMVVTITFSMAINIYVNSNLADIALKSAVVICSSIQFS